MSDYTTAGKTNCPNYVLRLSRQSVLLACLTPLFFAAACPAVTAQEKMPSYRIIRDLTFAKVDQHELKLDLYLPDSPEPNPLVVWIHGGGWRGGSRNKPPLRHLVDEGFALASVSYRFTDEAIFPAQIHDCKAAIRWLRANQEKYNYLADWIGVSGGSAGGHLALLLGTTNGNSELEGALGEHAEQSSAVQAVVDYYGPSDFVLRAQSQREIAYTEKAGSFALLGGRATGTVSPELERLASPAFHVDKNSVPLLAFHGTADSRVLMDQSQRMVEVYKKHDRPVELIRVKDAGHGGLDFYIGENHRRMVKFFRQAAARHAVGN